MSALAAYHLPFLSAAWFVSVAAGLAIGYGAGLVHFITLKSIARRIVDGDWTAVILQVGRLAGLTVVLVLLSLAGAQALLAGTAGILLARRRILKREVSAQ